MALASVVVALELFLEEAWAVARLQVVAMEVVTRALVPLAPALALVVEVVAHLALV